MEAKHIKKTLESITNPLAATNLYKTVKHFYTGPNKNKILKEVEAKRRQLLSNIAERNKKANTKTPRVKAGRRPQR